MPHRGTVPIYRGHDTSSCAGRTANISATPIWRYPGDPGTPDFCHKFRHDPIPPLNSPFFGKIRHFPDTPSVSYFPKTVVIYSKHPKIILTSSPLQQPQKKIRTHLDSSARPTYIETFAIRSVVPSTKVELRHLDFAKIQIWRFLTGGISCCFPQNAIFPTTHFLLGK